MKKKESTKGSTQSVHKKHTSTPHKAKGGHKIKHKIKGTKNTNMTTSIFVVVVVVLLALLVYFNLNKVSDNQVKDNSAVNEVDVLVKVNNVPITQSYIDKVASILAFLRGIPQSSLPDIPKDILLNQTISRELFYQDAVKKGYKMTKEEVEVVLKDLLTKMGLTLDEYKKKMVNVSYTYDDFLEFNRRQFLIGEYINDTIYSKIVVTDEEAKAFYDKNSQLFEVPYRIRASHILVKTEQEARDIINQLNNGADFAQLAKEKSIGPSASNGGDLNYFSKGKMVKEFEDAAFALRNIGDYTKEPVKTQFGYHIIKLTDKKEAGKLSFEEVKDQLKSSLMLQKSQEELAKYDKSLRENANIEFLNKN